MFEQQETKKCLEGLFSLKKDQAAVLEQVDALPKLLQADKEARIRKTKLTAQLVAKFRSDMKGLVQTQVEKDVEIRLLKSTLNDEQSKNQKLLEEMSRLSVQLKQSNLTIQQQNQELQRINDERIKSVTGSSAAEKRQNAGLESENPRHPPKTKAAPPSQQPSSSDDRDDVTKTLDERIGHQLIEPPSEAESSYAHIWDFNYVNSTRAEQRASYFKSYEQLAREWPDPWSQFVAGVFDDTQDRREGTHPAAMLSALDNGAGGGDDLETSPLSPGHARLFRALDQRQQKDRPCSSQRFVLFSFSSFERFGFGAAFRHLVRALDYALATQRVLVLKDPDDWMYVDPEKCNSGFACLFQHPTSCRAKDNIYAAGLSVRSRIMSWETRYEPVVLFSSRGITWDETEETFAVVRGSDRVPAGAKPLRGRLAEWRSLLARYLFQLSENTAAELLETRSQLVSPIGRLAEAATTAATTAAVHHPVLAAVGLGNWDQVVGAVGTTRWPLAYGIHVRHGDKKSELHGQLPSLAQFLAIATEHLARQSAAPGKSPPPFAAVFVASDDAAIIEKELVAAQAAELSRSRGQSSDRRRPMLLFVHRANETRRNAAMHTVLRDQPKLRTAEARSALENIALLAWARTRVCILSSKFCALAGELADPYRTTTLDVYNGTFEYENLE